MQVPDTPTMLKLFQSPRNGLDSNHEVKLKTNNNSLFSSTPKNIILRSNFHNETLIGKEKVTQKQSDSTSRLNKTNGQSFGSLAEQKIGT